MNSFVQASTMSPIDQFMKAVAVLATPDVFRNGIFMNNKADKYAPPSAIDFLQNFELVFVDASGWLNLAATMSSSAMQEVH